MDTFFDVRSSPKCIRFHQSLIRTSQDLQRHMLGHEWLAKVDNETSTPYLLVGSASFIVRTLTKL